MTSCGELPCERWRGLVLGAIGCAHFAQGQQEGEGRLRALIAIDAIGLEPIATAAGRRIVEPLLERVLAEEPSTTTRALLGWAGIRRPLAAPLPQRATSISPMEQIRRTFLASIERSTPTLEHRYASVVVLTLEQIEALLGFALPAPARTEREWWTDTGR